MRAGCRGSGRKRIGIEGFQGKQKNVDTEYECGVSSAREHPHWHTCASVEIRGLLHAMIERECQGTMHTDYFYE